MFEKITEQEVNGVYVQSAPDKLTGSAEENKRVFDKLPLFIADKYNGLVDSLSGSEGAVNLGATAVKEGGAENVQGILAELRQDADTLAIEKVDKIEGKGLSTNDLTDEMRDAYDTASNRAGIIKDITAVETEVTTSDDKIPTSNAVKKAIDDKVSELGAGDMAKNVYDKNDSGVVDDSERLGGELPEYYATAEALQFVAENATGTKVVSGISVLSTAWVDETGTTALWRCRITNAAIVESTIVNVHFDITDYTEDVPSSLVRATNAGLLATTTSGIGYVDIYATSQPDSNLVCTLELVSYKVV